MEIRKDVSHDLSAPHFPFQPSLEDVNIVIDIASDDDVSFELIATVMQSRPAIAMAMIKTANSASFGAPRQIRSLRHALALMGLHRIRNLLAEMKMEAQSERSRAHIPAFGPTILTRPESRSP
ncbi:HDOD domain-containing protein [Planctomicrobium sp. SH661]|uniref:HDOD domain-containing protein n=1 Tax=Planctomicrobium sp. SH661 TaxID=3448124 RepID=UPI003F5C745D